MPRLEPLGLHAHRAGRQGSPKLSELLGLRTPYEMGAFLQAHAGFDAFTLEEIEHHVRAMEWIGLSASMSVVVADAGLPGYLVVINKIEGLPR
jgi:hypothetical protein